MLDLVSKSMVTKSMFGLGYGFCKPTKIIVGACTHVMGMKYLGVVEHHFCCMETTSSNCWTCSWLPPLWIFIARGWLICLWCHLVSRWGIYGFPLHNQFNYNLMLFIGLYYLWCIHVWCIHSFMFHRLYLLVVLHLCKFLNRLMCNLF